MAESELADAQPKRRKFLLAAGGAIGGAVLTLVGQAAFELFKESRETQQSAADAQAKAMEELSREYYDGLGDLPRRAQAYLDNGSEGGPDDVRRMERHFRRLVIAILNHRVRREDVIKSYGNELMGWGVRFSDLHRRTSPAWRKFSEVERANFGTLGEALTSLATDLPDAVFGNDMDSPLTNVWANSNVIEPDRNAAANGM